MQPFFLCNFEGKQVIKPEDLEVLDPTELAVIPSRESIQTVEKIRDVLKNCVLMKDERAHYLLLGIEFEEADEEILRFVEDYRVHLIIPKEIGDFSKFKTDLGKAMKYIAVSEDTKELLELQKDESFGEVDAKTVELLNSCIGCKIPLEKGKEKVKMSKGYDGIMEIGKEQGIIIGRERTKMIFRLHLQGKNEQEIADECKISVEEVREILM